MNTTRTLLLPLLFGLVVIASSAAAQNESERLESYENMLLLNPMPEPEGDFGIIMNATSEIKENLDQIKAGAEDTMPQLLEARERRDFYIALSNDSSTDEEERLLNHAKALGASVCLNLVARKAIRRHQEHLVEIEKQLEQMIRAAHRLESEKIEVRSLISEIEQHTHGTARRGNLIAELIEVVPLNSFLKEAWDASKLSGQQNVVFEAALNLLKASSNLPDYSSRYEEFRQSVEKRRDELSLTEKIIDDNLHRIREMTIGNWYMADQVEKNTPLLWF